VDPWEKTLFTSAKTEVFENSLTMTKTIQSCWDGCEFALKIIKIKADRSLTELALYWLTNT
jgi:hypothetical protein